MSYEEVKINLIKSNPNNPRGQFTGPKFDDLVASIRTRGVLEPILVRPTKDRFEVVAGERRFRALQLISEDATKIVVIPAIVRKLSDEEAFEIMLIENLQREDLTPLEEARSFELYIKKRGDAGILTLEEKTGIRATYIRRRIAALQLPQRALEAWEKGTLTFGHLEELIRLKDKQDRKQALDRLSSYGGMSVKELRNHINSRIPMLNKAQFDKTECESCMQNSAVQQKLWDIDAMKKTHCLNPKCFKKKQVAYLTDNWPKTTYAHTFKTNGFAFNEDLSWNDHHEFYGAPYKKCLDGCPNFKTVIHLDGSTFEKQSCVLGKECMNALSRAQSKQEAVSSKKEKRDGGESRIPWHGQHFRELFFQERIPEQYKTYKPDDVKMLRTALFAMIKMEWNLYDRFREIVKLAKNDEDCCGDESEVVAEIVKMKKGKLLQIIQELSLKTVLSPHVSTESRCLVGEHLGINLSKEWAPVDEFYQLKTIPELLEYGKTAGILEHKKAQTFLTKTLKKKKFTALKKTDLIRVFKESGINLTGKVPAEILGK